MQNQDLFTNALVVKLVDTKDLKPLDVATLVYQTVSGSLKTLSILILLFSPSINIINQGKLICVDLEQTWRQRDNIIWFL